jgi:hypothetical protein
MPASPVSVCVCAFFAGLRENRDGQNIAYTDCLEPHLSVYVLLRHRLLLFSHYSNWCMQRLLKRPTSLRRFVHSNSVGIRACDCRVLRHVRDHALGPLLERRPRITGAPHKPCRGEWQQTWI